MIAYLFQVSTGNLLAILSRHYQDLTCLRFTDDSSHFISGGKDNLALVWSLARYSPLSLTHPPYRSQDIAFLTASVCYSMFGLLTLDHLIWMVCKVIYYCTAYQIWEVQVFYCPMHITTQGQTGHWNSSDRIYVMPGCFALNCMCTLHMVFSDLSFNSQQKPDNEPFFWIRCVKRLKHVGQGIPRTRIEKDLHKSWMKLNCDENCFAFLSRH